MSVPTTSRSTDTTEHTLFSIVHRCLEADLAKLETAVDDLTLANRIERGRKLDHWFRGYARIVRHHHRIEHELFWPALEGELGPLDGVRQLADDMAVVEATLDQVQKAFWTLRHSRDFVVPQQELVDRIGDARHALAAYIEREEAELVHRFRAQFTGKEFAPVDPRVTRGLGIGGVAFAVPWAIGGMTREERRELLHHVPPVLRLAYRLFRLSYQHKAAALDLWAPRSLRLAAA
jgi:hypothetical protein